MDSTGETREELRSRRISTEDLIREQLANITRIRGDVGRLDRVEAWSEALEALADLLLPWASSEDDGQFNQEWRNRRCRVIRVASVDGDRRRDQLVPYPNARDCKEAQAIIMGLLDRSGLLVKRRVISGPGKPYGGDEPGAPSDGVRRGGGGAL